MPTRRRFVGSLARAGFALPVMNSGAFRSLFLAEEIARGKPSVAVASEEDYWAEISRAFDTDPTLVNLNNGGCSPAPAHVMEAMIRDLLAKFGVSLPKLGEHWHHVFVLMWLLMGTSARMIGMIATRGSSDVALGWPWLRKRIVVDAAMLLAAGACALVTGITVGTQSVDSPAVLWWPLAGFALFGAFVPNRYAGEKNWSVFTYVAIAAAFFAVGVMTMMITSHMKPLFGVGSFGLVFWVCAIGLLGLVQGVLGLSSGKGRQRLMNPGTAFGMDVIGAYAIAFALAWLFGGYLPG